VRSIDERQVINACMAQLEKSFGEQALSPIDTHYLGWAGNDFIASEAGIAEPFRRPTLMQQI
jgi:monoamine oxidase